MPKGSTIDISEIYIAHDHVYGSFSDSSKALSYFQITTDDIDLDTTPFSVVMRLRPTNDVDYLVSESIAVNSNSYSYRSICNFHDSSGERLDMWWNSSSSSTIALQYPTGSGTSTHLSIGSSSAKTDDDIILSVSFHGGRTFSVHLIHNGTSYTNSATAGVDLGVISSISLNGYGNNYIAGYVYKSIQTYNSNISFKVQNVHITFFTAIDSRNIMSKPLHGITSMN